MRYYIFKIDDGMVALLAYTTEGPRVGQFPVGVSDAVHLLQAAGLDVVMADTGQADWGRAVLRVQGEQLVGPLLDLRTNAVVIRRR